MQPANTGSSSMAQLTNVKMAGGKLNLGGTGAVSQPKLPQSTHMIMAMTSGANAYQAPQLQNTKVNFHN